jgi:diaminohydroxyphosphoribosylaminopyrimidine deaminase/5-amino-6-(5-phosphoribosylamino)uracil reductase
MRRALDLAWNGRYATSPNPMVGCVIVRDNRVLGEGFHVRAGLPHAEINAIGGCPDARGATMYVTLEPCAHYGKTPPCADAVVAAGISRVVIGMVDPNPAVDGKGLERLRENGIQVDVGILANECARLNETFIHSVTTGLPFVLLKAGMTMDGKLATVRRESRWITSAEARAKSLELREQLGLAPPDRPWIRVVVDTTGDVPASARLFTDGQPTLLFTSQPERYNLPPEVEVVSSVATGGKLDVVAILRNLSTRGVRSLIVEGGSLLYSDMIARSLWQKLLFFVAPMMVGGPTAPSIFSGEPIERLTDAYRFRFDAVERVGPDLMITAYP